MRIIRGIPEGPLWYTAPPGVINVGVTALTMGSPCYNHQISLLEYVTMQVKYFLKSFGKGFNSLIPLSDAKKAKTKLPPEF